MRYMINLKLNKKVAFFGLLILNARAIGIAIGDQKNVPTSKVEMPTIDENPYLLRTSIENQSVKIIETPDFDKNITQDEAPEEEDPIPSIRNLQNQEDACNAPNGDIYVSCQDTTKGKGSAEFIKCMEKTSPYDTRPGDLCCPNGQDTQFYDCQPTPPPTSPPSISSSSGITWWEALLIAVGVAVPVGYGVWKCVRSELLPQIGRRVIQEDPALARARAEGQNFEQRLLPRADQVQPQAEVPLNQGEAPLNYQAEAQFNF